MTPTCGFVIAASLASVSTIATIVSNSPGPQPAAVTPPMLTPQQSEPVDDDDVPPPLPPRRKRELSTGCGELSPVRMVEPPVLPPRDAPPLPPRMGHSSHTMLQRHSMPLHAPPSRGARTLPRQSSQEHFAQLGLGVNGDRSGSVTPELPPKTYRASSRKQSS